MSVVVLVVVLLSTVLVVELAMELLVGLFAHLLLRCSSDDPLIRIVFSACCISDGMPLLAVILEMAVVALLLVVTPVVVPVVLLVVCRVASCLVLVSPVALTVKTPRRVVV